MDRRRRAGTRLLLASLSLGLFGMLSAAPAQAQYCPGGYYYAPGYGCAPAGGYYNAAPFLGLLGLGLALGLGHHHYRHEYGFYGGGFERHEGGAAISRGLGAGFGGGVARHEHGAAIAHGGIPRPAAAHPDSGHRKR